jgi:hypothetical protein
MTYKHKYYLPDHFETPDDAVEFESQLNNYHAAADAGRDLFYRRGFSSWPITIKLKLQGPSMWLTVEIDVFLDPEFECTMREPLTPVQRRLLEINRAKRANDRRIKSGNGE